MLFLIFIFVLSGLELLSIKQYLIWWILPVLSLIILLGILHSIKFNIKQWNQKEKGWKNLNFVLLPFIYFISIVLVLLFIKGGFFRHFYIIGCSVLFWLLLYNIKKAANHLIILNIERSNLSYINDVVTLVSAFLVYSGVFGFYVFFNWPTWLLIFILTITTIFLSYQFFWFSNLFSTKTEFYILILGLIILEVSWVLSFWVAGFFVRGIVLFAIFYVFIGLTQHYFKNTLNKKVVGEHLFVSFLVILAVLMTAKWTLG